MSVYRRMDKEDVVHIYNGMLLSHKKNERMPFVATQMDLEVIILSETEKDKYHMISLTHPGESQGRRVLVGCRLWGCTESDTTEAT